MIFRKKTTKVLASLMLGGLFTAVITLNSGCSADSGGEELELSTATIKGKVNVDYDKTNSETNEDDPPDGTLVTAWINTRDLVHSPTPGKKYKKKYFTTEIKNGKFELDDVEVNNKEVDVTLEFDHFYEDQTTTDPATGNKVTEEKKFTTPDASVSIRKGQVKIINEKTYN
ncbi:MAG: hypothetical protein ABEH43_06480 [Flavobacteriales bacterium]